MLAFTKVSVSFPSQRLGAAFWKISARVITPNFPSDGFYL